MRNAIMKKVSNDLINLAIRRDLLTLMAETDTSLDFCSWAAGKLNSNQKTIAIKFQQGYWTTKDFDLIISVTGGRYLKEAFLKKSQS